MKKYFYPALFLITAFFVGAASAASLLPVQEMIYCNSDAHTVASVPEPNDLTDRQDVWHPNDNYTESSTTINVLPGEYVYGFSGSNMSFDIDTSGESFTSNRLFMFSGSYSYSEITTVEGIEAFSWAGAETVEPGVATGNFYEIIAEEGESVGDWVTVTVNYTASVMTDGEGGSTNYASVYGHDGEAMIVTRNCADFDAPQAGELALSFSRKDSDGEYDQQATFSAQVGDVIGIHCGVYTNAFAGQNGAWASASADLYVIMTLSEGSAPFDAANADFDGSGRVDMGDLAMFASVWLEPVKPVNDDCSNPIELTVDQEITGHNFGATGGPRDTCSQGNDGKDVWYVFTAPESGFYDFNLMIDDPEAFDSTLSIWGDCVDAEIDCAENYGDEHIYFWYLNQDDVIYVRVAGYDGPIPDEGQFRLSVTSNLPS